LAGDGEVAVARVAEWIRLNNFDDDAAEAVLVRGGGALDLLHGG
jgi:hypothetical protein